MDEIDLSPQQSRMARAGIDISVAGLAKLAGISKTTLASFEGGNSETRGDSRRKIRDALSPYVVFVPPVEGMHGGGVLLREKAADLG